jgi:hypothetical protein
MGYQPIGLSKTSLKQNVKNPTVASEFDNMYYKTSKIKSINSGSTFYKKLQLLKRKKYQTISLSGLNFR